MQNRIATIVRATAMVGFIIAGPRANAQPLELPTPAPIRDLLRKGDTFAAIRELRLAEAANPKNGETVLLLAYAYYLAGQKKLFSQKATAAAALLPQSPEPRYALGRYYLDDVQRRDLAATEFRAALALDPRHAPSLYHLGWCLELDKQPAEAARLYTQANSWLGHLGLARLALDAGEPREALQHAQIAARLQPNAPLVHALIAKIHQRQGDCKQAIPSLQRAAALDPSDAALLYQLSRCAAATGNTALQRESLKQYEQLRAVYSSQ